MRVLFLFALTYCFHSHAQDSTVVIRAGEPVPMTDLYQYAQFVNGKVFFKSGDSAIAKLNYNKLLEEMQFIGPKDDTLNFAYPGTVRSIRINADVFYYDNGYVKLIKDTHGIKLAEKQTLEVAGKNKMGAYGMESTASAIDSYGKLFDQKNTYNLVSRENIILTRKTQYYFGDKYNHFFWMTRKNLLQQFSNSSKKLSAYLKDNNVDLNNREDIEKLFQFLTSL